jgi:nitrite reductase/ring-hydroxylating ferredoxin subunit
MSKQRLKYRVGSVEELRHEGRRVISVRGRCIGIVSVDGEFFAVRNRCPHMGAPLCEGTIGGTFVPSQPHEYVYGMDNKVIRCPWHGWEFELTTGRSLLEPETIRVKVYQVTVDDGVVILHV